MTFAKDSDLSSRGPLIGTISNINPQKGSNSSYERQGSYGSRSQKRNSLLWAASMPPRNLTFAS